MTDCIRLNEDRKQQVEKLAPVLRGYAIKLLQRYRLVDDDRIQDLMLRAIRAAAAVRSDDKHTLAAFCFQRIRWDVIEMVRKQIRDRRLPSVVEIIDSCVDMNEPDWDLLEAIPEPYRACVKHVHGIGCEPRSYEDIAIAENRCVMTIVRRHRKACAMLLRLATSDGGS